MRPQPRLVGGVMSEPGARAALGFGDFLPRHLVRDVGTAILRLLRTRQGGEIEPFVRGDEINCLALSAGPGISGRGRRSFGFHLRFKGGAVIRLSWRRGLVPASAGRGTSRKI